MSDFKNVLKTGWHPKGKDGSKESWRGDFKGINQVAGWMGKGKTPGSDSNGESSHMSRPLATLKDPSLFGPPPRNVNYHGGAALPNQITPHTGGIGAPLTQEQIATAERASHAPTQQEIEEEEEAAQPAGPPLPYRSDRTGLKTDHLPPPPIHRALNAGASQPASPSSPKPKTKPSLPPRLPPRQASTEAAPAANPGDLSSPAAPPSAYETPTPLPAPAPAPAPTPANPANGILNQGAMNRLGKVGVSVPAFGIGDANPWKQERSQSSTAGTPPPAPATSQLNELQSRFSRMNPSSSTPPSPPAQGTTLEQKQAALRTAQNFHRDPSSVTLADAQSAASTANNFRERHQDQITAGAQKANSWNKKYNVAGRVSSFLEQQASPVSEQPPSAPTSPPLSPEVSASINRKPPPPPPPKKPTGMHAPPPVPLGTKPSLA